MYDANSVLNIAKQEVGYLEKATGNVLYLYDKKENAGSSNYTKYGYEMHGLYPATMDYPAYWCDSFVDWCFQKAYGVSNAKALLCGNFDDYTVNSAALYKKTGNWGLLPKVGAQIFFQKNGKICHTGLVISVGSDFINTVEGNTSGFTGVVANGGCVAIKQHLIKSTYIAGYGYPPYTDQKCANPYPVPTLSNGTVIKIGSTGDSVKWVQDMLNHFSMKTILAEDGIFGLSTEAAVKNFQTKKLLTVDGIVGIETLTELMKL